MGAVQGGERGGGGDGRAAARGAVDGDHVHRIIDDFLHARNRELKCVKQVGQDGRAQETRSAREQRREGVLGVL